MAKKPRETRSLPEYRVKNDFVPTAETLGVSKSLPLVVLASWPMLRVFLSDAENENVWLADHVKGLPSVSKLFSNVIWRTSDGQ